MNILDRVTAEYERIDPGGVRFIYNNDDCLRKMPKERDEIIRATLSNDYTYLPLVCRSLYLMYLLLVKHKYTIPEPLTKTISMRALAHLLLENGTPHVSLALLVRTISAESLLSMLSAYLDGLPNPWGYDEIVVNPSKGRLVVGEIAYWCDVLHGDEELSKVDPRVAFLVWHVVKSLGIPRPQMPTPTALHFALSTIRRAEYVFTDIPHNPEDSLSVVVRCLSQMRFGQPPLPQPARAAILRELLEVHHRGDFPDASFRIAMYVRDNTLPMPMSGDEVAQVLGRWCSLSDASMHHKLAAYSLAIAGYASHIPRKIATDAIRDGATCKHPHVLYVMRYGVLLLEGYRDEDGSILIAKDELHAIRMFTRAAGMGDRDACFYLSDCFLLGKGNQAPNRIIAEGWMRRAATAGHPHALAVYCKTFRDEYGEIAKANPHTPFVRLMNKVMAAVGPTLGATDPRIRLRNKIKGFRGKA